jgi:primary-amine oxidase
MTHPLQRLGADEMRLARGVLAEHGLVGEHTRFAYLGLEEPPKQEVLAFRPGEPVERRVRAILLDTDTGAAADTVVSLTRAVVDSLVKLDTARDGQPPIMREDLVAIDEIVKGDKVAWEGWRLLVGFDAREGLTLHQLSLEDRPVVYRASIAEMMGPLRRPGAGQVLAELLRRRRVPARPAGRLADARL